MKNPTKIFVTVAGVVLISGAGLLYALFHGYFDHGRFEIKKFQWSSANQVAMVAERSDNEALGGLEFYVLIGNHLFTPAELRHALYSDAVVFRTASDCIDLRWESPSKLVIACHRSDLLAGFIDVQKQQSGNIAISYENIPVKGPK